WYSSASFNRRSNRMIGKKVCGSRNYLHPSEVEVKQRSGTLPPSPLRLASSLEKCYGGKRKAEKTVLAYGQRKRVRPLLTTDDPAEDLDSGHDPVQISPEIHEELNVELPTS
ncbi:MAG: hypothetical protein N0C90_27095, partial [Candidatus Thiodiazotropha endolucinida]|nr:hypothetical protein [Candidatus Thiodiazotropha taylori]MCW4265014.1 hypothetical protein [Candidatus Thiodiazotropha endolucinida]